MRYAYFPAAGRLAVNVNGKVSLYDTSGHQIAGLSQQQASGGGVMFSTGAGSINLTHLPSVSASAEQTPPSAEALSAPLPSAPAASPETTATATSGGGGSGTDVFATLERLGDLMQKGILTEDEFSAKKAELLSRL